MEHLTSVALLLGQKTGRDPRSFKTLQEFQFATCVFFTTYEWMGHRTPLSASNSVGNPLC